MGEKNSKNVRANLRLCLSSLIVLINNQHCRAYRGGRSGRVGSNIIAFKYGGILNGEWHGCCTVGGVDKKGYLHFFADVLIER